MVVRIFSALRGISIIGLLIVFLFVYANLSDSVGILSGADGRPDFLIGKNTFFFAGLALFAVTNAAFSWTIRRGKTHTTIFSEWLVVWLCGLSLLFNVFYLVSLIFFNAFNSLEKVDLNNFGFIVEGVAIITGLWLLGIVLVMTKRHKPRENNLPG